MTLIDEIINDLRTAIDSLHESIRAAATQWDAPLLEPEGPPLRRDPTDQSTVEAWTPRDAAEHATLGLLLNVHFSAQLSNDRLRSMADFAPAWMQRYRDGEIELPPLTTAASATDALATVQQRAFDLLHALPQDALAQPATLMPRQEDYLAQRGVANAGNAATALQLSITHLLDHAAQIRRAIDAAPG